MHKNISNAIESKKNLITLVILIAGVLVAILVYKGAFRQKTYAAIDEWGIKFENTQNRYDFDWQLGLDALYVNDVHITEENSLCGTSIGIIYHRISLERLDHPDADNTKIETLELVKTMGGYNFYLEKQVIPDFCNAELKESQNSFDATIYEIE